MRNLESHFWVGPSASAWLLGLANAESLKLCQKGTVDNP